MIPSPLPVGEVLQTLHLDGHLPEPAPPEQVRNHLVRSAASESESPWFVKGLVGAGSFVAVCLLLIFLYLVKLLTSAGSALVVGGFLLSGAVVARWIPKLAWAHVTALAVAVTGELLIVFGVVTSSMPPALSAGSVLVLLVVMFVIYPDRLHRFFAAGTSVIALVALLFVLEVPLAMDLVAVGTVAGIHALVLSRPGLEANARWHPGLGPLLGGTTTALFGLMLASGWYTAMTHVESTVPFAGPGLWATLGFAAVLLGSLWSILSLHPESRARSMTIAALALAAFCGLTLRTPGLVLALGLLVVTFHRRQALLLSLSLAFLPGFGALYYYDLSLTLLAKSGALVGAGLLLLGLRALLLWRAPPPATPAPEVS